MRSTAGMKLHWNMKKPLPLPFQMADERREAAGDGLFNGVAGT